MNQNNESPSSRNFGNLSKSPKVNSTLTRVTYTQLQSRSNLKKYNKSNYNISGIFENLPRPSSRNKTSSSIISQGFGSKTQSLCSSQNRTNFSPDLDKIQKLEQENKKLQDENQILRQLLETSHLNSTEISNKAQITSKSLNLGARFSFGKNQIFQLVEGLQKKIIITQAEQREQKIQQLFKNVRQMQNLLLQMTQEFIKFCRQDFKNYFMKPVQQLCLKFCEIINQNEITTKEKQIHIQDLESIIRTQYQYFQDQMDRLKMKYEIINLDKINITINDYYQCENVDKLMQNQEDLIDIIMILKNNSESIKSIKRSQLYDSNEIKKQLQSQKKQQ